MSGQKVRSLGQILVKPCVHSRGHSFDPTFMKLCQNDYLNEMQAKFETGGHVGLKTRSLGQILVKPCVHSRGHSFDPIFMKLCQNINLHKV